MTDSSAHDARPLGLFIQPACLQHRYIRHANSGHIFERPERLRAVLLGVAAAVARLEEADALVTNLLAPHLGDSDNAAIPASGGVLSSAGSTSDDLSAMLSGLSIHPSQQKYRLPLAHLDMVPPPLPPTLPGQILLHHKALQLAHSPPPDGISIPQSSLTASSTYLKDLLKWATEAVDRIRETGCEIPPGLGLNQGDLYLGPGSVLAIEGAIQTVCQAVDRVCQSLAPVQQGPITPPRLPTHETPKKGTTSDPPVTSNFNKAFCAIRPPGHHCGEDAPSGFCYVNNVVVGALHAYLEHDIDRAIIIDFDLHHGNGTQALVMPLNAASHAEDLAIKAGKPPSHAMSRKGKRRRNWKSFYGSVHDIYSYPCEDGDVDLIKDASISLAAHGQYIENIHLQPYTSEEDFYERIYPKYSALLSKARVFMEETQAKPDRTIVLISAGFDACEHEHQAMQRHDRRVPTSFFSRYTKDIVDFANQHTEGKVVSVLEGGYSDKALTSAAMGHVIGLLGQRGEAQWWSEGELMNIERATKKKRTGKLLPFPTDLAAPYLTRTHGLLSIFEGTDGSSSTPPSAVNTPVMSTARMTLRERKKQVKEDDEMITPPPTISRRAKARPILNVPAASPKIGEGVAGSREIKLERLESTADSTPTAERAKKVQLKEVTPERQLRSSPGIKIHPSNSKASQTNSGAALEPPVAAATQLTSPRDTAQDAQSHASVHLNTIPPVGETPRLGASSNASAPKIMLRIPRIPPANPEPSSTAGSAPVGSVYPSLPTTMDGSVPAPSPSGAFDRGLHHELDGHRGGYREGSANTTASTGTSSGGEYHTAPSEPERL